MTNAEIIAELDEIMRQLMESLPATSPSIMARLGALRSAIARKPAGPSPLSGGGPGEEK